MPQYQRTTTNGNRTKKVLFGTLFALAAILTMFPPIYLAASGREPIFGVPRSLLYFVVTGLVITATVIALYKVEEKNGEVE